MKKQSLKFIFLFILVAFMCSPLNAMANGTPPTKQSEAEIKLTFDMRKLWIDHTIWTRGFIVSNLAGLEDQKKVLERLLQNQVDIGNAIKPYYGKDAGNKLTELLKEHILIAGNIIDAAKKGDQANLEKYNKEWYRNADDITNFLTSANPNWSKKELTDLLYMHLKLTTDEVVARIHKDWDADIRAFDVGENHIIKMADALTAGIVKQFPKKFE